jgi:hypothetical protein
MVKITSPLMSRFASGTLGSTLQFRRGPGGTTTGLFRPRQPQETPAALTSYAIILKFIRVLITYEYDKYEPYVTYAKNHEITSAAAYIHFGLTAWRNGRSPPLEDPTTFDESLTDPTTIAWNDDPEPGKPNLTFDPFITGDLTTLHLLKSETDTSGPKNCIHLHRWDETEDRFQQPDLPPQPFRLQALSWILPQSHPALSNILTIE